MEFDKTRVFTALNADELKPGSLCYFGDCIAELRNRIGENQELVMLNYVRGDAYEKRFVRCDGIAFSLAYFVRTEEEEQKKAFMEAFRKVRDYIEKHHEEFSA